MITDNLLCRHIENQGKGCKLFPEPAPSQQCSRAGRWNRLQRAQPPHPHAANPLSPLKGFISPPFPKKKLEQKVSDLSPEKEKNKRTLSTTSFLWQGGELLLAHSRALRRMDGLLCSQPCPPRPSWPGLCHRWRRLELPGTLIAPFTNTPSLTIF